MHDPGPSAAFVHREHYIRQISTVLRRKVYDYCFRGFEPQRTLRDFDVPAIPMFCPMDRARPQAVVVA
jgi:hypothetical protein